MGQLLLASKFNMVLLSNHLRENSGKDHSGRHDGGGVGDVEVLPFSMYWPWTKVKGVG